MRHISLGGLDVSRIGLGTMAMSGYYLDPSSSEAESIRTIQRALELGVTHIDTAEIYGPYANEELVGRALDARRDDVVVATKFGLVSHSGEGRTAGRRSPSRCRGRLSQRPWDARGAARRRRARRRARAWRCGAARPPP